MYFCPECQSPIHENSVNEVDAGEEFYCDNCGQEVVLNIDADQLEYSDYLDKLNEEDFEDDEDED